MKITFEPSLSQDTEQFPPEAYYIKVTADLLHDGHRITEVVEALAGLLVAWGFNQQTVVDGFGVYAEEHTGITNHFDEIAHEPR